jgi:hypothetical protein
MAWSVLGDFKTHGLPEGAEWSDAEFSTVLGHLNAAQSDIIDALRTAGNDMPLPEGSVSEGMKRRECIIGGYHYLRVRGWSPISEAEQEFVKEYERCIEWLKDVRMGNLAILPRDPVTGGTLDATPTVEGRDAGVVYDARRNWGRTWP